MKVYLRLYVSSKEATDVYGIRSSYLLLCKETLQTQWLRTVTTLILFRNLKFSHNYVRELFFLLYWGCPIAGGQNYLKAHLYVLWLMAGCRRGLWCQLQLGPTHGLSLWLPDFLIAWWLDSKGMCPKKTRWNLYCILFIGLGSHITSLALQSKVCPDSRRGNINPIFWWRAVNVTLKEEHIDGMYWYSHLWMIQSATKLKRQIIQDCSPGVYNSAM